MLGTSPSHALITPCMHAYKRIFIIIMCYVTIAVYICIGYIKSVDLLNYVITITWNL